MKIHKTLLAKYVLFALAMGATLNAGAEDRHLTTDAGAPVGDNQNSETAGPSGPVVLQDSHLIEKLQRFDRERIPERVVHARGTGAFGVFQVSANITELSRATVFTPGHADTGVRSIFHRDGLSRLAGAGARPSRFRGEVLYATG